MGGEGRIEMNVELILKTLNRHRVDNLLIGGMEFSAASQRAAYVRCGFVCARHG